MGVHSRRCMQPVFLSSRTEVALEHSDDLVLQPGPRDFRDLIDDIARHEEAVKSVENLISSVRGFVFLFGAVCCEVVCCLLLLFCLFTMVG